MDDFISWVDISGIGEGEAVEDIRACTLLCDLENTCTNVKFTPTTRECNLNAVPTSTNEFQDFRYNDLNGIPL